MTLEARLVLHLGLAEQGKLHALARQFDIALIYYREAMRMATQQGAPEVFFRHYLECVVEALEQSGAYREVLSYCDRALSHHATLQAQDEDHQRFLLLDRASLHQRRGIVLLKMGDEAGGREALQAALTLAREGNLRLEMAESVYGWLLRRLKVDARRLEAEQEAHHYYSVRTDTVDASRAIALPAEQLQALRGV